MSDDLRWFVRDLVKFIQNKYNESLVAARASEGKEDKFDLGLRFAYYDVLDLIRSQLEVFGHDPKEIGSIVPNLGQPIHPRKD
jgi:hypothetical protein